MRNALLFTIMTSLYALSSTMDFVDSERLRSKNHAEKAEVQCASHAKDCPEVKEQLALSGH